MSRKIQIPFACAGLAAGIVLGLFLKAIEGLTSQRVYTLLLNVDYIPILKEMKLNEWVEFGLHLFISILLGIFVGAYAHWKGWKGSALIVMTVLISLAVALLLYPTTMLSERTPKLLNGEAFSYWMLGHLLYGATLGVLLQKNVFS